MKRVTVFSVVSVWLMAFAVSHETPRSVQDAQKAKDDRLDFEVWVRTIPYEIDGHKFLFNNRRISRDRGATLEFDKMLRVGQTELYAVVLYFTQGGGNVVETYVEIFDKKVLKRARSPYYLGNCVVERVEAGDLVVWVYGHDDSRNKIEPDPVKDRIPVPEN